MYCKQVHLVINEVERQYFNCRENAQAKSRGSEPMQSPRYCCPHSADQNHGCTTTLIKPQPQPPPPPPPPPRPLGSDCNSLKIDSSSLNYRLRSVANQLVYLFQDPNEETINLQALKSDRRRIRNIFDIYNRILHLDPIDAYGIVRPPSLLLRDTSLPDSRLGVARQQVLHYIESMNGYCDSINMLRCILKSPTMARVIESYDLIMQQIAKRSQKHSQVRVRKQEDKFSIIMEWAV